MRLLGKCVVLLVCLISGCTPPQVEVGKTAGELLGNSAYTAISFGGFRKKSREMCPTVEALKEDMKILSAMNIRLIRTYNTQLYPHAERTLQAIRELKEEHDGFEMHVMLGAWIECQGAWTEQRDHTKENEEGNHAEIEKAIELAQRYTDIVKIIAVGNESMVHWAETYFVSPDIVLKYVQQLQQLKQDGKLNQDLWITSSDNFASWGGGSSDYHRKELTALIQAVDYVSMHTYPFHDTHYNSEFWRVDSTALSTGDAKELMDKAMGRAKQYAITQYESTRDFVHAIAPEKPIHIGETGWSTSSHHYYGKEGSRAAGEFQQKLYYDGMRKWSEENEISCFFFEAFDEQWKDLNDERASENHFGLIDLKGRAKYVLWDLVDADLFKGLTRGGVPITKTFDGEEERVLSNLLPPPIQTIQE